MHWEWLTQCVYPHRADDRSIGFGVVGGSKELGSWGKLASHKAVPLLCVSECSDRQGVGIFEAQCELEQPIHETEPLELRLVVFEYRAYSRKEAGEIAKNNSSFLFLRYVAVECGSTFPRLAQVSYQKTIGVFEANLDMTAFLDRVRFADANLFFPSLSTLSECSPLAPLLSLHFYGSDPRFPFHRSEWKTKAMEFTNESRVEVQADASSLLTVCSVYPITVPGCEWSTFLPKPHSTTPTDIVSPSSASSMPVLRGKKTKSNLSGFEEDRWSVQGLERCSPVRDEGLDEDRTQEFWIATVNTGFLGHRALKVDVEVPLKPLCTANDDEADKLPPIAVGSTVLTSLMFNQGTHGMLSLPVRVCPVDHAETFHDDEEAELWVLLHIQYTLHYPFPNEKNNLRLLRSIQSLEAVSSRKPVGHRGLGKTFTRPTALGSSSPRRFTKLAENSLEALQAAHKRGCEMVEFDVMLTQDGIPIVFHDPMVEVLTQAVPNSVNHRAFPGSPCHSQMHKGNVVPISIPVHQLAEKQLRWVVKRSKNLGEVSVCRLKAMLCRYWSDIIAISRLREAEDTSELEKVLYQRRASSGTSHLIRFMESRVDITHDVPTLKELLLCTPSTLRFNIEVKYPFQPFHDKNLFLQKDVFEINRFVDSILDVVFKYADENRSIAFSSFEPDICVALMMKQCRYEVLFLSCCTEVKDLKDYRAYYVEGAIQFATSHRLSGISVHSAALISETNSAQPGYGKQVVDAAHRRGLKVWTWGEANSNQEFFLEQINVLGVNGVITDDVLMIS